jgi:hypothetical protein
MHVPALGTVDEEVKQRHNLTLGTNQKEKYEEFDGKSTETSRRDADNQPKPHGKISQLNYSNRYRHLGYPPREK